MDETSNLKSENSSIYENSALFEDLINYQDYFLLKDNNIYKFIIGKNKAKVFIKSKNYIISFNQIELSIYIKKQINSLNESFNYIINIFEENKASIKKIIRNEEIQLTMRIGNERDIEIKLKYNKNNENDNLILTEIKKLKDDIKKLKKYQEIIGPKNIGLLSNLVDDSHAFIDLDNSFTVFKAINDILYLIYTNKNRSIISYDLNEQKKMLELKNVHKSYITSFNHYFDEINKRDLIISVSKNDNNIKIWNSNNWELIQEITSINNVGWLSSSCFLKENKQIYIITSDLNKDGDSEHIKVFDLNGQKIKEINNSNERTYITEIFYDDILCKNYIITGNKGYIKSYDYNNNQLYHKYNDNDNKEHFSIILKKDKNIIKLIESSGDGNIRIWNFHSNVLLAKIKCDCAIYGICLWNDNYLFSGCSDKTIKLIELEKGLIIKSLESHTNKVITMKKIIHPKYGECLISQNWGKSIIKLWGNENNYN